MSMYDTVKKFLATLDEAEFEEILRVVWYENDKRIEAKVDTLSLTHSEIETLSKSKQNKYFAVKMVQSRLNLSLTVAHKLVSRYVRYMVEYDVPPNTN